MKSTREFDVFVSYNSNDREVVEKFITSLSEINLHPFLDIWNLTPGKPWQEELESVILRSKNIAIFIGESGIGRWQNEEMRVALDHRVSSEDINVIPILLPGSSLSDLPTFLKRLTWIDFSKGLDNKKQYNRLISSLGVSDIDIMENNIFIQPTEDLVKIYSNLKRNNIEDFKILSWSFISILSWPALAIIFVFIILGIAFFINITTGIMIFDPLLSSLDLHTGSVPLYVIYIPIYIYILNLCIVNIKRFYYRSSFIDLVNTMRKRLGKDEITNKNIIKLGSCRSCGEETPSILIINKFVYRVLFYSTTVIVNVFILYSILHSIDSYSKSHQQDGIVWLLMTSVLLVSKKILGWVFRIKHKCLICDALHRE